MFLRRYNPEKISAALKASIAFLEILMAIPVVAWMFVITTGFPIFIMLLFHTVSLIVATKTQTKILGNILGIFASFLAIIPVLGWLLHVTTAIVLLVDVIKYRKKEKSESESNVVSVQRDY